MDKDFLLKQLDGRAQADARAGSENISVVLPDQVAVVQAGFAVCARVR